MKDPFANRRYTCSVTREAEMDLHMTEAGATKCRYRNPNNTCSFGPKELKCEITRHATLYRNMKEFEAMQSP